MDHLEGISRMAHCLKVPLQVFSGETTLSLLTDLRLSLREYWRDGIRPISKSEEFELPDGIDDEISHFSKFFTRGHSTFDNSNR